MLSSRRAVLAALQTVSSRLQSVLMMVSYVSFSKVTVALCVLSGALPLGVTDREVILPLMAISKAFVSDITHRMPTRS